MNAVAFAVPYPGASSPGTGGAFGFSLGAGAAQSPRSSASAARSGAASRPSSSPMSEGTVRVRVAARVRPLLPLETSGARKSTFCVEATGCTVGVGRCAFTFDCVFGPEVDQQGVYEECVLPLVDATFEGIHGTLLAYGQTGSGKTYTMGTSGLPSVPAGALQLAIKSIFERAEARAAEDGVASRFRVSYVEIFTDVRPSASGKGNVCAEEVRDLLAPGRAHAFATVRVDIDGQMRLDGVSDHEVHCEREALALLAVGSVSRSTSATRMNDSSSRSHAIFSIEVIQRLQPARCARDGAGVSSASLTTAKFQFVDLAGSEKVKLSGAEGEQLSQAININHGLFVLGKVITALTDGSTHVPFRESKLTRILQNSLGGNSQTCMIACVSPADANMAETISTLKYAAKAKEIRNKPVANHLRACQNCAILQAQIDSLQKQVRSSQSPLIQQDCLHRCLTQLEAENQRLREENARLQRQVAGGHDAVAVAGLQAPAFRAHSAATGDGDGGRAATEEVPCGVDVAAAALVEAESRAKRFEALFKRCSERLAAAKQALRAAEAESADLAMPLAQEPDVDEEALFDGESDRIGVAGLGAILEDADFDGAADAEDAEDDAGDVSWLDEEARRKGRLMLQVEENHHAMAVLEQQSQERLRQHEAARDIAERELARLQTELEAARGREERLEALQGRYDRRLEALRERNVALEREQRELSRVKAMLRQQETKLKVLQDSIRNVSQERNQLKKMLEGERRARMDSEARGRKDKCAAEQRIRSLSKRVAALQRSSASSDCDTDASTASARPSLTRRHSSGGSAGVRAMRSRPTVRRFSADGAWPGGVAGHGSSTATSSASSLGHGARPPAAAVAHGAIMWEEVLGRVAERAMREKKLARVTEAFEVAEAKALEAAARRDRLSVRSEVEGIADISAELGAAEADAEALSAALEYQREQVWLARSERDFVPEFDLAEVAEKVADGMEKPDLVQSLRWLVVEVAHQRAAVVAAAEAQEAIAAELAACRAALEESEHRTAEQEQAFDLTRSDYESRVAFLLKRLSSKEAVHWQDLQDVIGEDTVDFLTRRVAELEDALARAKEEGKGRSQKRVEQDMEFIMTCRRQASEVQTLRAQVAEASARAERAVTRGAQKEAHLQEQVRRLEERLAEAQQQAIGQAAPEAEEPRPRQPSSLEVSWGLDFLEDFWRSTGLVENREELLRGLRADVEHLCEQRLRDHMQWKEELETKIAELRKTSRAMAEQLSEELDAPPDDANLLQTLRILESQAAELAELQQARSSELGDLLERLEATHTRLHGDGLEGAFWPPEDPRRLHRETLEALRARLLELEVTERERQAQVSESVGQLRALWATLGVQVPQELAAQDAELLTCPPPVSDAAMAHAGQCRIRLEAQRSQLEKDLAEASEELEAWLRWLAPFALELPADVPHSWPLRQRLEATHIATVEAQDIARGFVQRELVALSNFAVDSRLPNVSAVCQELGSIDRQQPSALIAELRALARDWERIAMQREEYRRLAEFVSAREALEEEMQEFDVVASDPNRFKRRGYSGVQENRRRADHQRRLRALDTSISTGASDWLQREGIHFCLRGNEYRGAEILPSEHTHMYAWTGRQMAQKEATRASADVQGVPTRAQPGQAPSGFQAGHRAAPASGGGAACGGGNGCGSGAGSSNGNRRRTVGGDFLAKGASSPRSPQASARLTSPRDPGRQLGAAAARRRTLD